MSLWIKADNRLIDADKAFEVVYMPSSKRLTLKFPGDVTLELEGDEADAAWRAIQSLLERRESLSDLKYFQQG